MRSNNLASERIGNVNKNNFGSIMTIVKYNNSNDLLVKFEKGSPLHATWQNFCMGSVQNPYDNTVYGVGYMGKGGYKSKNGGKTTPQYNLWVNMLTRCYNEKYHAKQPSYLDCKVCEEWHDFQNFAAWYDQNYYEIEGQRMCLDKDILVKFNKVYSPDTCVFVPQTINKLFTKRDSKRGNLPIGVKLNKPSKIPSFEARASDGKGIFTYLGRYNSPEEAFSKYKEFKEKLIKTIAEDYRNIIPRKLYDAMYTYEVEITD